MPMSEDLSTFLDVDEFATAVVIGGVTVNALFDVESQVLLGEVVALAPTLLVTADVVAADGTVCVVNAINYRVRQVLLEPPDGAFKRLVLAKG
jgi:hypothetical protein